MQKLITHLWFDSQAEEAANFYVSVFKNSKVVGTSRYTAAASEVAKRPKGSAMTVELELDGQKFIALNGGPEFKLSEAISLLVNCTSQEEIDKLWQKLASGGEEGPCGWLKDKYGLSWQIVPTVLAEMVRDPDAKKVDRVMSAILKMKKLDLRKLEQAYAGE